MIVVPEAYVPTMDEWIVLSELIESRIAVTEIMVSQPTGYRQLYQLTELRELQRKVNLLSGVLITKEF